MHLGDVVTNNIARHLRDACERLTLSTDTTVWMHESGQRLVRARTGPSSRWLAVLAKVSCVHEADVWLDIPSHLIGLLDENLETSGAARLPFEEDV